MKKSKLIGAAVALVLVLAVSAGATLAYFTSQDQVINTFSTRTGADGGEDQNLAVKITEEGWVEGADGKSVREDGANEGVYPGQTIDKAPYVKNTGRYDAFIRVECTHDLFDSYGDIQYPATTELKAITAAELNDYAGANPDKWVLVNEAGKAYFYYTSSVPSGESTKVPLFDSVTFKTSWDSQESVTDIDIALYADAIQADGFREKQGIGYRNDIQGAFAVFAAAV